MPGSIQIGIRGSNLSEYTPEVPVSKGKVGLVKISAVTWGEFDEKETKTVEDLKQINPAYFIKEGDFLISRANTIELVGAPVIVKKIKYDIMLSDKVWRVTFNNHNTKLFVHHFIKSPYGRREIESRATGNQLSMRNLSQKNFRDIDIELPPIEEQIEIVRRIDSLLAMAGRVEARHHLIKEKIDNFNQSLLTKTFQGKLVEQFPKDGDAAVLINQIERTKGLKLERGTLG